MNKKGWKKSNIEDFNESNNVYFTKDVENQIIKYKYEDITKLERDKIYQDIIYPVFTEMILIMIHRFKFYQTGMDTETLTQVVNVHMYHQLNSCNFDPDNGKAYSYFSRMAKNKLIQLQDKNQRLYKKYGFESLNDDENFYENILYEEEEKIDIKQFLNNFIKYLEDNVEKMFEKNDEISIAYNIINIMKEDKLVIENKKILYYMIKEQGDNRNYKINKVINTFKSHYERLKNIYLETYIFDFNWYPEIEPIDNQNE